MTSTGLGRTAAAFRLLAFDLDGTLLEPDGSLSDASAAFLRELSAAGVRLVAATGRRLHSALPHLRKAVLSGACVVHNGAMIADIASALPLDLCVAPRGLVASIRNFKLRTQRGDATECAGRNELQRLSDFAPLQQVNRSRAGGRLQPAVWLELAGGGVR